MNRRAFLRSAAGAIAALGVAWTPACRAESQRPSAARRTEARPAGEPAIGIQLYTVRELMAADPERTLAALAEIGYREVEFAGLHGRTARELRAVLERSGLGAPAGHFDLAAVRGDLDRVLDDALALGHRWIIVAWIDAAERTRQGYERTAGLYDRVGARARRAGLRFAHHNHDYDLAPVSGIVPYELLLSRTDPALVDFEMDLFWMRKGGGDPLDWFSRHPGRFPLVHVKDMAADGRMVNVGEGVIDFAAIFAESERAGFRHYFVEHDDPSSPLADARTSYANISKLLN